MGLQLILLPFKTKKGFFTMNINKMLVTHLEYVKSVNVVDTYNYYLNRYKYLIDACRFFGYEHAHDIKQKDLIPYWKNKGLKNNTIKSFITYLFTVFNFHNVSPIEKRVHLVDDCQPFKALTDDQLKALFDELKTREQNLYVLATYLFLDTGARSKELFNIKTSQIDLLNKNVYLEQTKNHMPRYVKYGALSDVLLSKLINHDNEYLFSNLTMSGYRSWVARVKKKLGFERLHNHMYRKTFATRLYRNDASIYTIQKLLGHKDVRQTIRYLDLDISFISAEYDKKYMY